MAKTKVKSRFKLTKIPPKAIEIAHLGIQDGILDRDAGVNTALQTLYFHICLTKHMRDDSFTKDILDSLRDLCGEITSEPETNSMLV